MTLEVLISHRRRKKNISHKGNVPQVPVCNRPQCLDNILYIHAAFVRVPIPFLWHKTFTKPENSFPFSLFAWARWQLASQPLAFSWWLEYAIFSPPSSVLCNLIFIVAILRNNEKVANKLLKKAQLLDVENSYKVSLQGPPLFQSILHCCCCSDPRP